VDGDTELGYRVQRDSSAAKADMAKFESLQSYKSGVQSIVCWHACSKPRASNWQMFLCIFQV